MPVIDDIREARESIKSKGFKYKLKYYVHYYKWHVIIGIILVLFTFSLIKSIVTKKDVAFEAIFVNSHQAPEVTEFAEKINVDLTKFAVIFDTTYDIHPAEEYADQLSFVNSQKLMANLSIGEIDSLVCDKSTAEYLKNQQFYADLEDIFGTDFVKEMNDQGKILYLNYEDGETGEVFPPFPVGIDISDSNLIKENTDYDGSEPVYVTFVMGRDNLDNLKAFYEYIK